MIKFLLILLLACIYASVFLFLVRHNQQKSDANNNRYIIQTYVILLYDFIILVFAIITHPNKVFLHYLPALIMFPLSLYYLFLSRIWRRK